MRDTIVAEPVLRRPATPGWLTEIGAFCSGLTFDALPATVIDRAVLVVADGIGAIAAGAQEPEVQRLADRRVPRGETVVPRGERGVPLIGLARRGAAEQAAFFGGLAGTMLELDEGNQFARGHPAIHVLPAVLAEAERLGRTGRDVITALVLGYEIGARIGIASKLRVSMHPHGTWGTVGAAVAVAHVSRATAAEMIEVINVASSLGLTTSRRTMLEGGTVRNTFAGLSNQLGLMAWDMVAAGLTGEADGLTTVYGTVAATDWQPAEMVRDLGTRWEIARNYFKRHACCRYNHGALDALLALRRDHGAALTPDNIDRIDIATYVWAAQLASQEPHNMLAAKFSLPFSIATTLVNGAASVEAFRDEARADPRVTALAARVFVAEEPAMTAKLPALRPARVRVRLQDGRVYEETALTNRGDTEDPYSPDEVRAKFMDLATPVYGDAHALRILATVDDLPRASTLSDLSDLL